MIIPLAILLVSASPVGQFIALPDDPHEGIIVPPDSPVQFRNFDQYGRAHFTGKFVLTGTFTYRCNYCEPGAKVTEDDLELSIVPDPTLLSRLPHWRQHDNDTMVDILQAKRFTHDFTAAADRRALISGKRDEVTGRIAIVVDDFQTGIDCDSANFSAKFVSIAKPVRIAQVQFKGDYGCA
jgi:hypothetical protein